MDGYILFKLRVFKGAVYTKQTMQKVNHMSSVCAELTVIILYNSVMAPKLLKCFKWLTSILL